MVILGIVQARMSSTRLPGKVLADVEGDAMIIRQLERLSRSSTLDRVVVATSDQPSDDGLASFLTERSIEVRRGALNDVASRFWSVVQELQPDHLVRLTADCPLADHEVIDRIVSEHLDSGADYTSNTQRRTYPQGLDAECVTRDAFTRLMRRDLGADEREHVTLGIYTHPGDFRLHSVEQERDLSPLRWTVDRPDDLDFVREVYAELYAGDPDFRQQDILDLLSRRPDLEHTN